MLCCYWFVCVRFNSICTSHRPGLPLPLTRVSMLFFFSTINFHPKIRNCNFYLLIINNCIYFIAIYFQTIVFLTSFGTIQIIHIFFYDLTMINLESYMIQSIISLEPYTSMVQSGIINGPDFDQTKIMNFCCPIYNFCD